MESLRKLERWLLSAEKFLLIGLILVIVGLSFLQVVLRGVFSGGFLWADTFLRHIVLWVGFLGAAVAAGENKQFAMDAAARVFKGRVKALLETVAHAFTIAVCAFMARASWEFMMVEREFAGSLFSLGENIHVPIWYFEIILPVGFVLILLHYAIKLILALMDARKT